MKLKKANHPATFRKLFLLIRQMPWSSSGGLSCLGFLTSARTARCGTCGFGAAATAGSADGAGRVAAGTGTVGIGFGGGAGRAAGGDAGLAVPPPPAGTDDLIGGSADRGFSDPGFLSPAMTTLPRIYCRTCLPQRKKRGLQVRSGKTRPESSAVVNNGAPGENMSATRGIRSSIYLYTSLRYDCDCIHA